MYADCLFMESHLQCLEMAWMVMWRFLAHEATLDHEAPSDDVIMENPSRRFGFMVLDIWTYCNWFEMDVTMFLVYVM